MSKFHSWINIKYTDSGNYQKLTPQSIFEMTFSKTTEVLTTNYRDALVHNAKAIADSFPQPFDVLLSGGIDSEVVVRLNKDLGIKQNVYVFKFENNINIRDVESAKQICNSLSIPLKIIDFNLEDFFEKEAESLYKKTFISRIEYLPRFYWQSYFDNLLVQGGGEPYLRRELEDDYSKKSDWVFWFYEYDFAHDLYSCATGDISMGNWYYFTPDIYVNYCKESIVKNLIQDQLHGKISTMTSRIALHREIWTDIQDKIKLTGYEGAHNPVATYPKFMDDFKSQVMKGVSNTVFKFDKNTFENLFK